MDPVSHAVLGAAVSQRRSAATVERAPAARAALLGALAPDLDLLIRSADDPLLSVVMHRQFTHSLVFLPVGALVIAALVRLVWRDRVPLRRLWLYAALGFATHIGLDVCTSYGVEMFWPFTSWRPALSIVSTFDPLFTLPAIGLVAAAGIRRRPVFAAAAVCWGLAYLCFGAVQAHRARSLAVDVAASRGHAAERLMVVPSFANTLVWKTLYEYDGRYYVDAVRVALTRRVYPGDSVRALDTARDLSWLARGSLQADDLARFRAVSAGYVAPDPEAASRVIELRYSLVPNRIAPYWKLDLDPHAPAGAHARVVATADRTPAQGLRLLDMVLARDEGFPASRSLGHEAGASLRVESAD